MTSIARRDYHIGQFHRDLLRSASVQESAGVRMDCVTAHKQGPEQIAVGDWRGDVVEDVLEDFIILPSHAPEVASPVNAEVILCRDAGRPQ
jgi:hypothetical protein